jgi:hypothetical protein
MIAPVEAANHRPVTTERQPGGIQPGAEALVQRIVDLQPPGLLPLAGD